MQAMAVTADTTDDTGRSRVMGDVAFRVLLCMVAIQMVLAVLHVLFAWQDESVLPLEVSEFFHFDREYNLPSWFAASQFLCLAFVFGILYTLERAAGAGRKSALLWLVCAVGAVFLSLDESARIHEISDDVFYALFLTGTGNESLLAAYRDFPSYKWLVVYVPLVLPVALAVFALVYRRIGRNRLLLCAGAVCFLLGAVVLDYIEGRYGTPAHTGLPLIVGGHEVLFDIFLLEETLEMLGLNLTLAALAQHAVDMLVPGKAART